MKLENESIFLESTLCDKPFSKASELNNDAFDSERLMIETEESHDRNSCDLNGWNQLKEDSSSIESSDKDDVKAENIESFENDSEIYAAKNVPECDLPKPTVCFEENSCNIVKDIRIDERMNPCSSPVEVVFESDENEENKNDALMKEPEFANVTMADELEISKGSSSEKDSVDRTDLNESILVTVLECDENDSNNKPNSELEPCNDKDGNAIEEHSSSMSSEIENSSNPSPFPAFEEAKTVSEKSDKLAGVEDAPASQIQHGIGESSFSSAAPLASLISYYGPVAYSGNLSIRSDSSTTSTRSFAFPILQPEWHHNSPVRMAEADRRFFRKHKGWRQGLFCCRF